MRWPIALSCFAPTACSAVSNEIPQGSEPATYVSASIPELKKAASDARLAPPLEVAGPIEASPVLTALWIICLRSGATDEPRRRVNSVFLRHKIRFNALACHR
jgi:hypothetical protein